MSETENPYDVSWVLGVWFNRHTENVPSITLGNILAQNLFLHCNVVDISGCIVLWFALGKLKYPIEYISVYRKSDEIFSCGTHDEHRF